MQAVGYIGMGIMGAPMARNLLEAGCGVTVWNRTASKCAPLEEAGAQVAATPKALAEGGPEAIFLNVTATDDVEEVLFGEAGVAAGAQEGLIVVDNSTISPVAAKAFAERLAELGVALVDAPVSGGDTGAKEGTLSIMCGGDEAAFAKVRPLLEVLGKSVVHLGPAGSGQACKACNQIAVSLNLLGTCEALALGKQFGLDLDKLVEVLSGGAAGSWQLANLGPKIAAGDDAPGFMIDLVRKDLAIVLEAAHSCALPLSGTGLVAGYFASVKAEDGGRLGTQAMAHALEKLGHFRFSD